LGIYSLDFSLLAYPKGGETVVERLADGQQWTIPSGGRAVSFSPDGSLVSWTAGQAGPPFDTAQRQVWTSRSDGSRVRQVIAVMGGGLAGWFPDGRMLVSSQNGGESTYWAVSPQDGSAEKILQSLRLRGAALSPDGAWLAYQVVFSGDLTADGLWLANTHTGQRMRLDVFGAYRWRDSGRLLIIPLDLTSASHLLWQVDAASGKAEPLTDPELTSFKVANGDWAVSPDGQKLVFVSASDQNLWLLSLP
jgi:Tol biopolymer transport system component